MVVGMFCALCSRVHPFPKETPQYSEQVYVPFSEWLIGGLSPTAYELVIPDCARLLAKDRFDEAIAALVRCGRDDKVLISRGLRTRTHLPFRP